jgi:hypothetical protein
MFNKKSMAGFVLGLFILAGLWGCGGMVKTTRVVNGRKVTTWTSPEEAKWMEEKEAKKEKQRVVYLEEINKAEKRKSKDPIIVALFETDVAQNLKTNTKGRLFPQLRKEFEKDTIIILVDQKTVNNAAKQVKRKRHGRLGSTARPKVEADISVFTTASVKEVVGRSKSTGKLGKMAALVYTATISSHYFAEDTFTVKETGNIFNNVKVTRKFANKIKVIIKNKIGLNIPGAAYKQKRKAKQKNQFSDWMKSFKKKKEE